MILTTQTDMSYIKNMYLFAIRIIFVGSKQFFDKTIPGVAAIIAIPINK